ncbi:unnamed protein product [Ixodes persulcatus]
MNLLSCATQRLIVNLTPRTSRAAPGGGTACIPYMHNARDLTHSVKSLASRYGTEVIFRCRFRLGSMCKLCPPPPPPPACTKKQGSQLVQCAREKVYSTPLTCGAECIGQTGRCLNDRLREHIGCAAQPEGSFDGRDHQACTPLFNETKVVGGHRERYGREIIEAYRMTTTTEI